MKYYRIIPRLDIKGPNLVKGIHFEGLRVLGKPESFAKYYYEQGPDGNMLEYVLLIGDVNGSYAIPPYTIPSYNESDMDVTDYPYVYFDNNPLESEFFIGRWSIRTQDDLKKIKISVELQIFFVSPIMRITCD